MHSVTPAMFDSEPAGRAAIFDTRVSAGLRRKINSRASPSSSMYVHHHPIIIIMEGSRPIAFFNTLRNMFQWATQTCSAMAQAGRMTCQPFNRSPNRVYIRAL
jgi:hypothetical protein